MRSLRAFLLKGAVGAFVLVLTLFISYPIAVRAVGNQGDMECAGCQMDPKKPKFCPTVPCKDITNGHTTPGMCVSPGICKGQAPGGEGGGGGMEGLMQALKGLMDALKPKEGGGGGSGGGGSPTPSTPTSGCQGQYFQTSDITQMSNPCAQYTPPTSTSIDTGKSAGCDALSIALGTCNDTNSGGGGSGGAAGTTHASTTPAASAPAPRFASTTGEMITGLAPGSGVSGDLKAGGTGATAYVGATDAESNASIAGFYGAGSGGSQALGLIATWCRTRPWATNFLSKLIPPSFFDNLCAARGYQVGEPQTPGAAYVPPVKKKPSSTPVATSTGPTVAPKVDIWASPASVSLGGRTSIFWNTRGVKSCKETSSDGSFNQTSLSGGAATVPLTGATTFTISCETPDGSKAENSVTVNLSI